jgi:hypothetical protein
VGAGRERLSSRIKGQTHRKVGAQNFRSKDLQVHDSGVAGIAAQQLSR